MNVLTMLPPGALVQGCRSLRWPLARCSHSCLQVDRWLYDPVYESCPSLHSCTELNLIAGPDQVKLCNSMGWFYLVTCGKQREV